MVVTSRVGWRRPVAVVSAVAVLLAVVAVVLLGGDHKNASAGITHTAGAPGSASGVPGSASPAADGLSADEAALVAKLPRGFVVPGSCIPALDQEDPVYTEAGVSCEVADTSSTVTAGAPTFIQATLDRSPALLAKDLAKNFGGDAFGSDFAKPPAAGDWKYPTDPSDAPRVGSRWLYLDTDNIPHLDWSYDNAGIFIDANGGTSAATTLSWFLAANLRLRNP